MPDIAYILFFALVNISGVVVAQTTSDISLPKHPDSPIVLDISNLAKNIDGGFSDNLFSVYVANDGNVYPISTTVQGKYTLVDNNLIFEPYFPFEKGLPYAIKLENSTKENSVLLPFQIGEKKLAAQAKVLSIFPSSDLLPENVLRFYIYFQTPMKQEEALQHIKLIDNDGKVDDHAFMKFKEELWSSDGKRLTILFDPGRIKRGVSTNTLKGPALEKNHQYQLRISKEWEDVYGHQLSEDKIKDLRIVDAYREKIEITKWKVESPRSSTLDNLVIEFDRIIDHALIQTMMQIRDEDQNLIDGYWTISNIEKQAEFIPSNKWKIGKYTLRFDTRLEDVAGNNLQNLLDHNTKEEDLNDIYQYINFTI